ncbi:DNA cytosine methyltransferase [Parabacteroides sp. GYB001]|uniref:DNA cytosine methyltransferase n=1 Tax=Parabacteroides leei TaxID=2939491 RepID=UPI002017B89B|nr:DNA cytosine methyltransferase [Parabacteroides leei]MCL3853535.1 DNA cytosine methyltransferase [Parabacteroides leei]
MGKVHASLFSGFGAADLAATWMGWDNAFWCEIDDFPRAVLSYWLPKSKGYGNIKETDFTEWRGKVDVLTGGFPCQPFSVAGRRKGKEDDRYLWPEMLRAIREIRPTWIIGENVGGIISMVQPGSEITVESQTSLFETADKETILEQEYVVETICRDIEREGYSVQPVVIPACAVGAPHRRDRIWFIASKNAERFRRNDKECEEKSGAWGFGKFSARDNEWLCREEKIVVHRSDAGGESVQRERKDGVYQSEITSDTNGIRQQVGICSRGNGEIGRETPDRYVTQHTLDFRGTLFTASWDKFPTQPPVCSRNDGIPFDVEHLTIPFTKWRQESIKGYGNAIVPQVIYEIFKAIETIQD